MSGTKRCNACDDTGFEGRVVGTGACPWCYGYPSKYVYRVTSVSDGIAKIDSRLNRPAD